MRPKEENMATMMIEGGAVGGLMLWIGGVKNIHPLQLGEEDGHIYFLLNNIS